MKKKKKKNKNKKKFKKKSTRRKLNKIRTKKIKKKKNKTKKRKKNIFRKKLNKKKKLNKLSKVIITANKKFKSILKYELNFDLKIQNFFNSISKKIKNIKKKIEEAGKRRKRLKLQEMNREKREIQIKLRDEKERALKAKELELKEEIKLEKERKKELQKFIRLEQAEVRKEQAEKQRKFLEQIKLEKKIEKFRKREALEIKNLERFVLSQQRESYTEVQGRIEKIKLKYQALRDQKIRERVQQLGIKVEDGDDRSILLEKERAYNLERQKIEFALESFYRSAHSLCFQINKRYIPKYLSIMRVIDRRFETGEIFIKWDDAPDEDWLILIYIKNNLPDDGVIIEDKTNPEKHISHEFKSSEIFQASDVMVDALTNILDKERNRRKAS